jgi:DNA-directed RNA polymerase specialized sigma24 family protein
MEALRRQAALERARASDVQSLLDLLESFRRHLRSLLAELPAGTPAADLDALVDAGLTRARHEFGAFPGTTLAEFAAWLERTALTAAGWDPIRNGTGGAFARSQRMLAALANVSLEQQQVILGRHLDRLSFADLAQALGWSETAVRSAYAKGLRCLCTHYLTQEA